MADPTEEYRTQKKHNSLLLVACARGLQDDVVELVHRGADLGFKDKEGYCAIHFAAARGRLDAVQFLWSKAADLDAETTDGRTALHLATLNGHEAVVAFLLSKGALTSSEDKEQSTPLHTAARGGHKAIVDALLRHGATPDAQDALGLTPAGAALLRGHLEVVQALVEWGAEVKERPGGFSMLHLAAGVGRHEAVEWILAGSRDDVNDQRNREGASPLHSAAMASDYRSIALLLSAGADATAADTSGRLPIDCLPKAETPYEEDAVQRSKQLLEAAMKTVTGGKKKTSISTGRQAGSNGGKSEQAVEDLPPHAAFAAQSKEAQMAAARRWAMMSDDDALRAALSSFPGREAAFKRARAAAAVRRRINVFKALSALRADDEFQRDMTEPSVAEAVHVLRHDTSKYEQYASDPRVASVLGKMRRVHAALQANGQRTLPLDEVTVPPKEIEARKHADLEQLNAMEAEFGAQIWAAAAAAGAETVEEAGAGAAAAYEEELKRVSQGEGLNEQTTSGGEDEAVERVSWKAALLQQVLRAAVMLVIAWLMNLWMARKGASAGEAPGRSEV